MKKQIVIILCGLLFATCLFAGCKKEEAEADISVVANEDVNPVTEIDGTTMDTDEAIGESGVEDYNSEAYKEFICAEAEKCMNNIQVVSGEKLGRKYALLYDGYYYDFEQSDDSEFDPMVCSFSVDRDSYELVEADSWTLWVTVEVELECDGKSVAVGQFKFICDSDSPTTVEDIDLFQVSDREFPVSTANADADYYLVRNFDSANRTVELCKVSVGPNDLDTATWITGVIEDWKTYVVDENAIYSGWGINGCANSYFEESKYIIEKINCESLDPKEEYSLFAYCGIREGKVASIQEVLNP